MTPARYYARSASDKTENWPFWFVADRNRGGLNVTAELVRAHISPDYAGLPLTHRTLAEKIAGIANEASQ